jgi:flagellar motor switch protein FliG
MPFQGGPKEAAKMLAGLDREQREKALETIRKRDPKMAETLASLIVTIEDLQFITVNMLRELLTEIDLSDLGKVLRISSDELRVFVLSNVSSGMQKDLEDVLLGPPMPVSKVKESEDKILQIVRAKVDKGELIIKKDGSSEEMV